MTTEHQASRTLVKSPPELWAECSDAESLVRHIGEFGEIKITRLEPETTVAWEGPHASGTVEIEPSGWGTRVTLKVQTKADEVAPSEAGLVAPPIIENHPVAELHPIAEPHPVEEPRPVEDPDPVEEPYPVEEAADAKVEETSAEPALAVAAHPAPGRGWRRVIARTRTWFRATSARMDVVEVPAVEVEEAWASESVHPPASAVADPPATAVADPPASAVAEPPASAVAEPPPVERETAELEREATTLSPEDATSLGEAATPLGEAATPSIDPEAVLSAALDSLGRAHHRPYSRA